MSGFIIGKRKDWRDDKEVMQELEEGVVSKLRSVENRRRLVIVYNTEGWKNLEERIK